MDTYADLEKQWQATVDRVHQQQLIELIETVFKHAIDDRSPKMRPPGKAGLRAEKGYYRLLYLEEAFRRQIDPGPSTDGDTHRVDWEQICGILAQMNDIPELRSEIVAGIEAGLEAFDLEIL